MNDSELLQAIGEMLNPISNRIDALDARLDKIDARLDNLKGDLIETRIGILALSDPVKLKIPRDIHSLSDDVKNIAEKIQILLSTSHEKGV